MRKITASIILPLIAALALSVCSSDPIRTVTIFYTSDEHGYLEPVRDDAKSLGGAAGLMALLRSNGYDPQAKTSILLSGGDMWAGPAISSWFQGIPSIQVANAMGYDAAVIGNHEFDFGQVKLLENQEAADFPFLSANIIEEKTGKLPEYVQPYLLKEINGVKTAVIGLAGVFTPYIVVPSNVAGLQFTPYEKALRETVPLVRAQGAELTIVVAHACPDDLRKLAPVAAELSVPLLAGAHCHSMENFEQDGIRILGAGAHMEAFARVDISIDSVTGKVLHTNVNLVPVEFPPTGDRVPPDAAIDAIVSEWSVKVEEELGDVIGYSESGIKVGWSLYNLLVDSWLWAHPEADIAVSNFGGYRERLPAGPIKKSDIVATWPFDNTLVEVELTGKQLMENLQCCGGAVSGITYGKSNGRFYVRMKNGDPIDLDADYRVLVNSYIYEGGDRFMFSKQNPRGRIVQSNYRDPVIEWIVSGNTSREHPLEELLDTEPRSPG